MGDLAIPNLPGESGDHFLVAKAPSWTPLSENYRTTSHRTRWDAPGAAGVYFARLSIGERSFVQRFALLP